MISSVLYVLIGLFTFFLCSSAFQPQNDRVQRNVPKTKIPKGFGTAKHAVIIGIDGFGGVYLKNVSYRLPALKTFFDFGAHTTKSRNQVPTVSAPNWAAYLTSMSASQSGVYSNYWTLPDGNPPDLAGHLPPTSGRGRPQTIFSVVKEHNQTLSTALIFTWNWFLQIAEQNPHVDYWYAAHTGITCEPNETAYHCENRMDWNGQEKTVQAIKNDKPTLTFIHLDSVDEGGHSSYWGSDIYYEMVAEKDRQVAGILQALEDTITDSGKPMIEETIVAVVADHGGYRNSHGITPPMICEVYVPLLIRGPGVRNVNLEELEFTDVSSIDMTVTVLNALGIEPGKFMRGKVLEEIYGDDVEHMHK